MDRLDEVHRASRVQLPQSIIDFHETEAIAGRTRRPLPIIPRYIGIAGFMTCGAIVIATASFLALSIQ